MLGDALGKLGADVEVARWVAFLLACGTAIRAKPNWEPVSHAMYLYLEQGLETASWTRACRFKNVRYDGDREHFPADVLLTAIHPFD